MDSAVERGTAVRLGAVHTVAPVIAGDSKVYCIAAASLVAKVTRDRLMRAHAARWPGYGFERHKGYGTRDHMDAIARLGPSPIHRMTFAPLKNMFPAAAAAARAGTPLAVGAAGGANVQTAASRGGEKRRK